MALPILMCGKSAAVGVNAVKGMQPEYEVIHFISSVATGVAALPSLVLGREPPASTNSTDLPNFGSGNYGEMPVAILAGGGYDESAVATMREAILKEAGPEGAKVPWFRADMTKSHSPPGPAYAAEVAARSKARLQEVLESGEGKDGGVFFF